MHPTATRMSTPAWAAISLEELLRCGLLLPRPGEPRLRRILRLPDLSHIPPPPRPMAWSGEGGRDLWVPIFNGRGRLLAYCKRADGWVGTSASAFC